MTDPEVTIEEKSDGTEKQEMEASSATEKKKDSSDTLEELAASVKELAAKIPDSISKVFERTMAGRDLPLMVRVNDETLRQIDQLVEARIFQNRSECAAFLINEGIKAQAALFEKIESKIQEIEKLRGELKNIIHQELDS